MRLLKFYPACKAETNFLFVYLRGLEKKVPQLSKILGQNCVSKYCRPIPDWPGYKLFAIPPAFCWNVKRKSDIKSTGFLLEYVRCRQTCLNIYGVYCILL